MEQSTIDFANKHLGLVTGVEMMCSRRLTDDELVMLQELCLVHDMEGSMLHNQRVTEAIHTFAATLRGEL